MRAPQKHRRRSKAIALEAKSKNRQRRHNPTPCGVKCGKATCAWPQHENRCSVAGFHAGFYRLRFLLLAPPCRTLKRGLLLQIT
jgi:hypothetical protein